MPRIHGATVHGPSFRHKEALCLSTAEIGRAWPELEWYPQHMPQAAIPMPRSPGPPSVSLWSSAGSGPSWATYVSSHHSPLQHQSSYLNSLISSAHSPRCVAVNMSFVRSWKHLPVEFLTNLDLESTPSLPDRFSIPQVGELVYSSRLCTVHYASTINLTPLSLWLPFLAHDCASRTPHVLKHSTSALTRLHSICLTAS